MTKHEVRRMTETREGWGTRRETERSVSGVKSSTASAGGGRGVAAGTHSGSGQVFWACKKRASGGTERKWSARAHGDPRGTALYDSMSRLGPCPQRCMEMWHLPDSDSTVH